METTPPTQANIRTARVIAAAMAFGVITFWLIIWFLTGGGSRAVVAPGAFTPRLALWAWAALALAGFAGALFFRGKALAAAGRRTPPEADQPAAAATMVSLLVAWALLEAPALAGGVFFLMAPPPGMLWAVLSLYLVGVAMTFPRAEWFPPEKPR